MSLSESADLMLIAPATANIIGKLANGIADDMLTTMAMVARRIVICPAMNVHMYENPIVAANIEKLRGLGYVIIEPESGQACVRRRGDRQACGPGKIVSRAAVVGGDALADAGYKDLRGQAGARDRRADARADRSGEVSYRIGHPARWATRLRRGGCARGAGDARERAD